MKGVDYQKIRIKVIEEIAIAFEREIAWHNEECLTASGHPWYACECEVRAQAQGIRELKGIVEWAI